MNTLELTAAWASILGFFVSLGALWQARSAKTAATEAKRSIVQRLTTDELELACVRAEQLLDFLDHDRLPEATLRTAELVLFLTELTARRSPELTGIQLNSLLSIREQSQSIAAALRRGSRPAATIDKIQLAFVAASMATDLRGILGEAKGRLDREEAA